MIRFARDLMLGIALMTVGYTLQQIGRWMSKPKRKCDVVFIHQPPVYVARQWQSRHREWTEQERDAQLGEYLVRRMLS